MAFLMYRIMARKLGRCRKKYQADSLEYMHWLEHVFALPALPKGYGWYVRATTDRGILDYPELLKDQRKAELKERSIVVFTADRIVEVETKKNESITTLTDDQSS